MLLPLREFLKRDTEGMQVLAYAKQHGELDKNTSKKLARLVIKRESDYVLQGVPEDQHLAHFK